VSSPTTFYMLHPSPIGELVLAGTADALTYIGFPTGSRKANIKSHWHRSENHFAEARRQLDLYFAGKLTHFDLPLAPSGTPFQQRVWEALLEIPYGETTSYGALARKIQQPKASRAVGSANGSNPIPIIIPCHRVIGGDGTLTGFGGGLPTKRYLLQLEDQEQLSFGF
jgi:methylated-DNA-[protein]-cysteine S-methyltransferase